ncbi:MAG: TonB-dependent receptor [Smithellaceae bacterium]|nr:TonB-dependent receptor [Smithellaceae bacterium]
MKSLIGQASCLTGQARCLPYFQVKKGLGLKIFAVLSTFLSLSYSTVPAFGQTPKEAAATLEEIVVTATRDREEVRQVPANVSVITARQIEQSGATTIVEVLDKLESIQFRDYSGNSSQSVIDMRGFGGDNPFGKTLIMLDGRRLNRPDMSSINWLQIPLNNIERIEVVRGASSVLYGDAAIGGVINIITRKGEGKPKFNASVIAGSYGLHNERAGVTGAADKWTYAVTGENNFNFGYRDRSKSSSQGGGLEVGYEGSELFNASLGLSFNKTDYQMPGALTKAQMEQNRRQYQPDTPANWASAAPDDDGADKHTNLNLGLRSFLGAAGEFDINFLYGKKDLQTNMPSRFSHSDTNMDTYGITPKYILAKEIFGFKNKLIMGLDYYHEPYKKDFFSSRERRTKTSWAELTRDSLGFYLRDEFSLLKTLILNAGYRSERVKIKGSSTDIATPANSFTDREKTYTAEAYEAGLTWLVGRKSKIFAKVSSVYRIPFLDEVASYHGFGGGFLTSLEKEKGVSMEAGTEFYPLENLKIGLTLFRTDMEDEISWFATGQSTGYNKNQDKTRHDGAEVSLSYLWEKRARLYGNYTYHLATFENGANMKKEMPLVPNRMANAGMEIYLPANLTLRPEVRYVGDSFLSGDNDNNTEKLEAYTLYNLYLSYRPPAGKIGLTAFIGVENLTDVKYSTFGSDNVSWPTPGINTYYPMPGIAFKGGLSFEF